MMALAPGTALLVALLLAPGLVALVIDREPGKPMARCVLLCGMAGSVAPLKILWSADYSFSAAVALASSIPALGKAWMAAAAGWFCVEVAPLAARSVLEVVYRSRRARLSAERDRLCKAWNFESGAGDVT